MGKDTAALLVCAGSATRMGGVNKILHPLGESSVLQYVLRSFCSSESIAELVVVCRPQDRPAFEMEIAAARTSLQVSLADGGATRQESVRNGIAAIQGMVDYVAIHDGARPLVQPAEIEQVIADARKTGAATLGVPVKDTVKVVRNGIIEATPERATLYLTQTPQVFRLQLYMDAMEAAVAAGKDYTDDCQLVEALGVQVTMTTGSYENLKLTTPEDFTVAEALLAKRRETEI